MNIIKSIYQNKLYPCIVEHCSPYIYSIHDCKWHLVETGREFNLNNLFEEIACFYKNIGLKAPTESDLKPYVTVIKTNSLANIYVKYIVEDNYCITCGVSDKDTYVLCNNLSYATAVLKAQKIVDTCNDKASDIIYNFGIDCRFCGQFPCPDHA